MSIVTLQSPWGDPLFSQESQAGLHGSLPGLRSLRRSARIMPFRPQHLACDGGTIFNFTNEEAGET